MRLERDLCGNCDHWREEHYDSDGAWMGEMIGCAEYIGVNPTPERLRRKPKDLEKAASADTPEV